MFECRSFESDLGFHLFGLWIGEPICAASGRCYAGLVRKRGPSQYEREFDAIRGAVMLSRVLEPSR
jgi:hypothetical protein